MRLEKGFLHWKADILTEFDPFETGLDRFVRLQKPDFVGKPALLARSETGPRRKLVTLVVDTNDAPAHAGASVRAGADIVGTVTSGDWGHRTGLNLAYAFIEPTLAATGTSLAVDILGRSVAATIIDSGPYDPSFARMRS